MNNRGQSDLASFIFMASIVIIGIILIVGLIFVHAALKPWFAGQAGKAELAQAEQNRQIAILEATAKKEAAIQLAQAEIERAKGVAESNRIIGEGLKGNEEYLRYLWIQTLNDDNNKVIYIPTEANLPITEAKDD